MRENIREKNINYLIAISVNYNNYQKWEKLLYKSQIFWMSSKVIHSKNEITVNEILNQWINDKKNKIIISITEVQNEIQ